MTTQRCIAMNGNLAILHRHVHEVTQGD